MPSNKTVQTLFKATSKSVGAAPLKTTTSATASKTPINNQYNQQKPKYNWFERTRPYLFLAISGISFYGGTWQVKRRKEKLDYLDNVNSRINASAVDCPTNLTESELNDNKYLKVKIEGFPMFDKEIVVGPRVPPRSAGITKYPGWGGFIYTPIKLKDSNEIIIANRGWIPEEEVNRANETNYIDLNTGEYIELNDEIDNSNDSNNNSSKNNSTVLRKDNETAKKSELMSFVGLIAPLQHVPDFFDDFAVSKTFWPWISKEKMIEKWNDIGFELDKNQVPVTVNIIEPRKDWTQWPQRISESDLTQVTVSPEQHGSYVIFWYSMSVIAVYYSYVFWKNPSATRLFARSKKKPILRRSDVLNMPEQHLRL